MRDHQTYLYRHECKRTHFFLGFCTAFFEASTFFLEDAAALDSTLARDFFGAGLLVPTTLVTFLAAGFLSLAFLTGANFLGGAAFLASVTDFLATTLALGAGLGGEVFFPNVFFASFF